MADPLDDVSAALARADASYEPIPTFADWLPDGLDLSAWDEAKAALDERRAAADPADVAAALQERLRAAAVDTGAIEGLYDTDRGFTLSVAQQTISLDQAEVEKGGGFRRHFEAQLEGFERALDAATAGTPISEAFIRHLHEVTCAGQDAYRVLTPIGVQERRLALGTYKVDPNHVQLGDGSFHSYAPVDRVADEMHRLVEQLRSPHFEAAHPVVQAAYSHHAFTWIHPFPDGNGRVARLLASIWLLRSASIPLWIESDDRPAYIDALSAADRGVPQVLVGEFAASTLGLIREMGLIVGLSSGPQHDGEVENGIRQASARLKEHLQTDEGLLVTRWAGDQLEGPLDIEVRRSTVLRLELKGEYEYRIAAVLKADPLLPQRAFRVIGINSGRSRQVDLDEAFSLNELTPHVTTPADRRLALIARLMASRLRSEVGGTGSEPRN